MAVYKLTTPISEENVRRLKVNDILYVTGIMVTARDSAHKRAIEFFREGKKLPVDLQGLVVYHCGPLVRKEDNKWVIVAAGPTTSTRMDIFEEEFIKNFKARIMIGKGGMGKRTANAMKKYGVVYGAFTGGAAILAAKAIKEVKGVEWLDLGTPEALWVLQVEEFGPLTVAIDAHGKNLFEEIKKRAKKSRPRIYEKLGL